MATNTAIDFRLIEAIGTVFLSTIEGELLSLTYGLARFLRQGIEPPAFSLKSSSRSDAPTFLTSSGVDTLIVKLSEVTETLRQRNLSVAKLEARVSGLEQFLPNQTDGADLANDSEIARTIAVPERRLHAIEDSLNSVELLAGGLGQQDENSLKLNQRLSHLEDLLQTLSHLPTRLEQQHQVITRINDRLSDLEAQQWVDRGQKARQIEPDRVF